MPLPYLASAQRSIVLRGCRTCLTRISRHPLSPLIPRRTFLWWWRRGDSEWASAQDETLKQQIRLRNRRLQHKYAKALHRRNLWDRDSSHNVQRGSWMWEELDKLGRDAAPPSQGRGPETGHTSVRQKQSEEDPFMTLFGDRLTASQNQDSTWSVFSYEERGPIPKQDEKKSQSCGQLDGSRAFRSATSASQGNEPNKLNPTVSKTPNRRGPPDYAADEYEYDPISMRNIPKVRGSDNSTAEASKPLFDSFFAEKRAVDIPVKVYKPHRVYGHTAKTSVGEEKAKPAAASTTKSKRSENSRAAEFRQLRASTLGNSIDTAAEFHGKWPPVEKKAEEWPKKRDGSTSDALFAGTTYDGRFKDTFENGSSPKESWLQREGFTSDKQVSASTPSKKVSPRLEPSLDRTVGANSSKNAKIKTSSVDKQQDSRHEDLDLLRASDVRASAKSARSTKQERERSQSSARDRLDQSFKALESDKEYSQTGPIKTLSGLWQRIQDQEKSWLSGRVIPMDSQDQSKIGSKQKTQALPPKSLAEKIERPKILTTKPASPVTAFTPSPEVLKAERENASRTLSLRQATLETEKQRRLQHEQETTLAKQLNDIYLSEQSLAQASSTTVSPKQQPVQIQETPKPQPQPQPAAPLSKPPPRLSRTPPPSPSSPQVTPTLYKILAYDSSTLAVSSATTTSTFTPGPLPDPENPLSPPEILERLNNPVKFLPYFADLEKDGYEMVMGGGDVLIFKKVREGGVGTKVEKDLGGKMAPTTMPTTTGIKEPKETAPPQPPAVAQQTPPSNAPSSLRKVQRQEAVFSAPLSSSRLDWDTPTTATATATASASSLSEDFEHSSSSSGGQEEHPRTFGRVLKRVLLAGSGMAVVAYGVGVVLEGEDVVKRGGVGKRVVGRRREVG